MTGHPPPGRAELAAGLLAGGAALLLAAPVGLLWLVLAPRPLVAPQGQGQGLRIVDVESPAFFGSDAVLLLLGLAAGVLLALVAWRLLRQRALGALVGLVLGGLAAAYLAGRVGVAVGGRDALVAAARAGARTTPFELPLRLRAHVVLLGWPAGSAVTLGLLLGTRTPAVTSQRALSSG